MRLCKIVIPLLAIVLCMGNASIVHAGPVEDGIAWLNANQHPDGFWGGAVTDITTAYHSTSVVAETFQYLDISDGSFSSAVQWLSTQDTPTVDHLSRQIEVLAQAGIDVTEKVNTLLSFRQPDGGWGIDGECTSDVIDTALALQALKAANYSDQNVISTALGFLLSKQNPDGGWGFYPAACSNCDADPSNCYMTALVSSTLQQYAQTTALVTAINEATDYLIAHQNADDGFGSNQSTIYETALAYIALVGVTTDETILGRASDYLTSTQLANGSWLDDPYATALAIKALYLAENKPVPPPPPDKGTATGKVLDASTNAPLKAVSVTLEGDPGISTTTDQSGNFVLPAIPPGAQHILFTLPGYAGASASVTITAGTIVDLGTFPLAANPSTGIVRGTVTEAATGMPLSDVLIDMTGSANATATTGADGAFSFIDVTPGTVTLTASKAGYYAVSGSGDILAGGILFFNPQLPTTPPSATTGNLIGKVYDAATNQPIEGASIALAGGPSTTTGGTGAFTITDIPPQTYQVTIAAPGYIAQVYQAMIMAGVTTDVQTVKKREERGSNLYS